MAGDELTDGKILCLEVKVQDRRVDHEYGPSTAFFGASSERRPATGHPISTLVDMISIVTVSYMRSLGER